MAAYNHYSKVHDYPYQSQAKRKCWKCAYHPFRHHARAGEHALNPLEKSNCLLALAETWLSHFADSKTEFRQFPSAHRGCPGKQQTQRASALGAGASHLILPNRLVENHPLRNAKAARQPWHERRTRKEQIHHCQLTPKTKNTAVAPLSPNPLSVSRIQLFRPTVP